MKNKKIVMIGSAIITVCALFVVFLLFSSDIFGAMKRKSVISTLEHMDNIDFVLINDNRRENYFGGEYITQDTEECRELKDIVLNALKTSDFDGTKENFLGGFALIVRIAYDENGEEIKLWFYEDRIEIENGSDIVICKTADSSGFYELLEYTSKDNE